MRGRPARPVLPYAGYSEVHYPLFARRRPAHAHSRALRRLRWLLMLGTILYSDYCCCVLKVTVSTQTPPSVRMRHGPERL